MSDEITSGLLIIGVSSTVLFDGETSTTELILLNLANGDDFSLPISDEQASVLYAHLESVVGPEEEPGNGVVVQQINPETPLTADRVPDGARAFANQIGVGEAHVTQPKVVSEEAEETPQF